MDDDIAYALRIQANDYGIYDEDIIQNIINAYKDNDQKRIEELLNQTHQHEEYEFQESIDDSDLDPDEIYGTIDLNQNNGLGFNILHGLQPTFGVLNNNIFGNIDTSQLNLYELINQINSSLNNQNGAVSYEYSYIIDDNDEVIENNYQFPISNGPGGFFMSGININNFTNQINEVINTMANVTQQFTEPVPVTLTEKALKKIKDLSYKQLKKKNPKLDPDEKCAICMGLLSDDSDNFKYNCLPCNHVYHSECIKQYLKDYDYHCPICKEECGDHEAKL